MPLRLRDRMEALEIDIERRRDRAFGTGSGETAIGELASIKLAGERLLILMGLEATVLVDARVRQQTSNPLTGAFLDCAMVDVLIDRSISQFNVGANAGNPRLQSRQHGLSSLTKNADEHRQGYL